MENDHLSKVSENTSKMEEQTNQQEKDPESDSLLQPLLKKSQTLSSSQLSIIGTKISCNESLDYEINENDLFKHDWRTRSQAQMLQYVFVKWLLAFLVGLLTGIITTLINLAIENIAGYKLLAVVDYIERKRYMMGFFFMTAVNLILTLVATVLCVFFAPTAAGPGIPEIKAYLNGVDTPNMYGATTMFVKESNSQRFQHLADVGQNQRFDIQDVLCWHVYRETKSKASNVQRCGRSMIE